MKERINLLMSLLAFCQERGLKRLCLLMAILLMAVAPSYLKAEVSVGSSYKADNVRIHITKEPTEIGGHWEGALDGFYYFTSSSLTIPEEVYLEDKEDKFLCKITQIHSMWKLKSDDSGSMLTVDDIREITIPKTVLQIGTMPYYTNNIFCNFRSLENIYVDPDNPKYKSVNGVLFNIDETKIISVPTTRETYTIPNSVKYIDEYAFSRCGKLHNLTIPNSVTSIGERAFFKCDNLTSLVLSEAIDTMDSEAFCDCVSLSSLTIPYGVKSIGDCAFERCENLDNVIIPNSVTSIGGYAFSDCSSLTRIDLPESLDTIPYGMFQRCASLQSFIIPSGVKLIQNLAFEDCAALQTISLPESLREIEYSAFAGCQALEAVNMPNSVTTLGDNAFSLCIALKQINLSKSLTELPDGAFYKCKSLESITIPKNVEVIGWGAFNECSALAEITIPSSVKIICEKAFRNCSSLMTINSHRFNPPRLEYFYGDPFEGVPNEADIYVPGNCTSVYLSNQFWDRFYNYHEVFEWGELEGITDVVADEDADDAPVYNTLGVQVDGNYKGLVIKNGKKYIRR